MGYDDAPRMRRVGARPGRIGAQEAGGGRDGAWEEEPEERGPRGERAGQAGGGLMLFAAEGA